MRRAAWFGVNPCNCGAECAVDCVTVFDDYLYNVYDPFGFDPREFTDHWEIKGQPTAPGTYVDLTTLQPWQVVANLGISMHGATLQHRGSNQVKPLGFRYRVCVEVLDEDNYLFGEQYINEGIQGGSIFELGEVREGVETKFGTQRTDLGQQLHDIRVCYSNGLLVMNTADTPVTDPITPITQAGVATTLGTQSGVTMSDWTQMPVGGFDEIQWTYHYNGNIAEGCPKCDE
jgi:hypothetical protein